MLFARHHLHRDTSFARQSRLSVTLYQEVNFDWFPKKPALCDRVIRFGVICFSLNLLELAKRKKKISNIYQYQLYFKIGSSQKEFQVIFQVVAMYLIINHVHVPRWCPSIQLCVFSSPWCDFQHRTANLINPT